MTVPRMGHGLLLLALLGLGLCVLAGPAPAETYRFDMGNADSVLAPGYLKVTPQTLVETNPDFGWTKRPMTAVVRSDPDNPFYGTQDTSPEFALYSDAVLSLEENTFAFKVVPGRYRVTAVMGDLALGEPRPGQSLWANGVQIVKEAGTDASILHCTFAVDAPEGKIELRFRSDSSQQYVTVEAVTAEATAAEVPVAIRQLPETRPTPAQYRAHWEQYMQRAVADWELAKTELRAEGEDLAYWDRQMKALRQRPDYREYWAWSLGSGAWERLAQLIGDLPLGPLCAIYREMGIDGFGAARAAVVRELRAAGFTHAVGGSAERYPKPDMTGVTLNLMKNPDGTTTTVPSVWSNCAPEVIAAFQEVWRERFKDTAEGARFFIIDEPRGMWYAGRLGDYSAPAQDLFRQWATAQGYPEAAAQGIPEPGRTWDFYRFYQFRLNSVALFVKAFIQDTPVAQIIAMPGNGDAGPEQMNHSCYWPPAMARQGFISATWSYGDPAGCKMHAETLRIAQEHGGQTNMVPPLYAEEHTPVQDIVMNTAGASALNTRLLPWHFRGPSSGPNRVQWMKTVFQGSRLTHATSGLRHTPPLYVWCPESLVFNDLVEFNSAEAANWKQVTKTLFDANLDFAVTNTLAIPAQSMLLYACARPVLTPEEFGRLKGFVEKGGTVLCAFAGNPETPDGKAIAGWNQLPAARLVRLALAPETLENEVDRWKQPRNWRVSAAGVKTYRYQREDKTVHLLNNTDLAQNAALILPRAMENLLTGQTLPANSSLRILPGRYALLAE